MQSTEEDLSFEWSHQRGLSLEIHTVEYKPMKI